MEILCCLSCWSAQRDCAGMSTDYWFWTEHWSSATYFNIGQYFKWFFFIFVAPLLKCFPPCFWIWLTLLSVETWTTHGCKFACLLAQDSSCTEKNTSSDTCTSWDNGALFSSCLHAVVMQPKSVSQFDKGIWVQEGDWLSSHRWDDVHVPAVMPVSPGVWVVRVCQSFSVSWKTMLQCCEPSQRLRSDFKIALSFWICGLARDVHLFVPSNIMLNQNEPPKVLWDNSLLCFWVVHSSISTLSQSRSSSLWCSAKRLILLLNSYQIFFTYMRHHRNLQLDWLADTHKYEAA